MSRAEHLQAKSPASTLTSHPAISRGSLGRDQCVTVLLWKIHSEFVQDFSCVSLKSSKECTATIYYNKAKLAVVGKQRCKSLEQETVLSAVSTSLLRTLVQKGYQKQHTAINLTPRVVAAIFFFSPPQKKPRGRAADSGVETIPDYYLTQCCQEQKEN